MKSCFINCEKDRLTSKLCLTLLFLEINHPLNVYNVCQPRQFVILAVISLFLWSNMLYRKIFVIIMLYEVTANTSNTIYISHSVLKFKIYISKVNSAVFNITIFTMHAWQLSFVRMCLGAFPTHSVCRLAIGK